MRIFRRPVISSLFATALAVACFPACVASVDQPSLEEGGEGEIGAREDALLGVPQGTLPSGISYFFDSPTQNEIHVCFNGVFLWNGTTTGTQYNGTWTSSTSGFSTEISWFKSAIEAQWAGSTGVSFVWHSSCTSPIPTHYIPVVLIQGNALGSIGGLGAWGVGNRNAEGPYQGTDRENQLLIWVFKNHPVAEKQLKNVAVHEMGHVLGFAHEMDKAGWTPGVPGCTPGGATNQTLFYTADYDPDSIMNYCRDIDDDGAADAYTADITETLTNLDKSGAAMTYGFPAPWSLSTRNLCKNAGSKLYLGDFDGNGSTDIMCNDPSIPLMTVDRASNGTFTNADWTWSGAWCMAPSQEIVVGDVNGDSRADLVCTDHVSGNMSIDLAEPDGSFPFDNWAGSINYCKSAGAKMFMGKFNSDNKADIVCNDPVANKFTVDVADSAGHFATADWTWGAAWCMAANQRIHVGDVNGDGRDDLVCHDTSGGFITVDLAEPDGSFPFDNWSNSGGFCTGSSKQLLLADMDGNGRSDLVCRDVTNGSAQVAFGLGSGGFTDVKIRGPFKRFCSGSSNQVYAGKLKGSARSDLLCNKSNGAMSTQYSNLPTIY